jgi:hypothetical protein
MSEQFSGGAKRQYGEPVHLRYGTINPAPRICMNCGSEQPTPGAPWTCPECGTSQHSDKEIAKLPAAVERAYAVSSQIKQSLYTDNKWEDA